MSGRLLASMPTSDRPWTAHAACSTAPTDLFYPPTWKPSGAEPAKRICAACPVVDDCADWALATNEPDGGFGELTPDERDRLARHLEGDRMTGSGDLGRTLREPPTVNPNPHHQPVLVIDPEGRTFGCADGLTATTGTHRLPLRAWRWP